MNPLKYLFTFFALAIQTAQSDIIVRIKPDESASQDTYLRENGTTYPISRVLRVSNRENGSRYYREAFIAFPGLSELPSSIEAAYLLLYCTRQVGDRYSYMKLNVREPSKSWSESTLHWSNKPSSSSRFYERIYRSDVNDWVVMEVTDLYSNLRRNGRGVHLVAGTGEAASFVSSADEEWEYRPEMSVVISFPNLINPVAKLVGSKWVAQEFPGTTRITSHFGEHWQNQYAVDKRSKLVHTGIDLRVTEGTPVLAIHSGTIRNVTSSTAVGGFISIQYDGGIKITSTYHHVVPEVTSGAKVKAGDRIATVFDLASGDHLHVQMRYAVYNESNNMQFNITTVGRLPENTGSTYKETGGETGTLPAFPGLFIDLSRDVDWSN